MKEQLKNFGVGLAIVGLALSFKWLVEHSSLVSSFTVIFGWGLILLCIWGIGFVARDIYRREMEERTRRKAREK